MPPRKAATGSVAGPSAQAEDDQHGAERAPLETPTSEGSAGIEKTP
jgi:hypothetical protein